ncbi:MAG: DNA polymerase III subunit delta' [Anaerolineae bacterium]|nr:DNA polymerase III subunit delta' [Anaerolineae bacterium]
MSIDVQNWNMIGHEWAVQLLAGQISAGHARHAYLLTGSSGLGKTTLAMRLTQAFNCIGQHPPCGECRPCDLIGRGAHPDILTVKPEGTSIKIETIRDLQADLNLHPLEAHYRVALILDAHRLTDAAADALLKTLEEPPITARLILTAEVAEATLPTIVSRCQVLALRPVPVLQIEQVLASRFQLPPDQTTLLARLSGGRPGWALNVAQQLGDEQNPSPLLAQRTRFIDDLLSALRANRSVRMSYAESAAGHADELPLMLETWQAWWRDVLLLAEGSRVEPVNIDQIDMLAEVAHQLGREAARRALVSVRKTASLLADTNANTRLALDVMLLQLPYL